MEDMEKIAEGLLDGTITCDTCPSLNQLVEEVKNGKTSFDDFVQILKDSKEKYLKSIM